MDYFDIKNFVESLDDKVVDNYDDWIMLGQFLYNINNNSNYLNLWIEKSKIYSDKYDNIELVCNNVWNNMINSGSTHTKKLLLHIIFNFIDNCNAPHGTI